MVFGIFCLREWCFEALCRSICFWMEIDDVGDAVVVVGGGGVRGGGGAGGGGHCCCF